MLADLAYLEERSRLFYTRQSTPKGLGHAVRWAPTLWTTTTAWWPWGFPHRRRGPRRSAEAMMEAHRRPGSGRHRGRGDGAREETFRYGIVSIDGAEPPPGEPVAMTDIVEKPPWVPRQHPGRGRALCLQPGHL